MRSAEVLKLARIGVGRIMDELPMTPHLADEPVPAPWMATVWWECPDKDITEWFTVPAVAIGPRHLATCAHAFGAFLPPMPGTEHVPFEERKFFARVGARDIRDGERREIVGIVTAGFNPQPVATDTMGDLAVLTLDEPVDVPPIRIATTPATVGDRVSFLGWHNGTNGPGHLVQINTVVIDPAAGATSGRGDDEFCAANAPGPAQAVNGFSGGPVIRVFDDGTDPELLGTVSRGTPLGDNLSFAPPAVLADVASTYRTLVLDTIGADVEPSTVAAQ